MSFGQILDKLDYNATAMNEVASKSFQAFTIKPFLILGVALVGLWILVILIKQSFDWTETKAQNKVWAIFIYGTIGIILMMVLIGLDSGEMLLTQYSDKLQGWLH